MLASPGDVPLQDTHLAFEPKYDGIRALVDIEPRRRPGAVAMYSRQGHEKSAQFPELVREMEAFARRLKAPVLLDGEIVALDEAGHPASFTRLQPRLHVTGGRTSAERAARQPAAFVAFDILRDGDDDVRALPLSARRLRLERVFTDTGSPLLRLSAFAAEDGRGLYRQAESDGWEGLIAKHLDSQYRSGRRTADWRKIKLVHRQEFVVGGWTDRLGARGTIGALLLGARRGSTIEFVGSVGSGFDEAELARLAGLVAPLARSASPYGTPPKLATAVHWLEPALVVEVKFAEWTPDGHLRHPVYLGVRDDVDPAGVRVEDARKPADQRERAAPAGARRRRVPGSGSAGVGPGGHDAKGSPSLEESRGPGVDAALLDLVIAQLDDLEAGRGEGVLALPDGSRLEVSHLGKIFWPAGRLTKGALMRHYVRVSPWLLPVIEYRPLIMKRFPNGVAGKSFYQQKAPSPVPEGIRVEAVPGDTDVPSRLIGSSLRTLLYMAQLAAISQDPWFSRVQSPESPDFVAFDLDPMPGVAFRQVLDVARWVRDELDALGITAVAKTSGATGLHIFVRLPEGLPYEAGQLFAQIVATMVAQRHPRVATVERSVGARGRTVYVDYLQNIRGKSLACAYSARASEFAGVSTPLTWAEVDAGLDPGDFTIETVAARLREVGDLWAPVLRGRPANLSAVLRYAEPA